MDVFFPVLAVERCQCHTLDACSVYAAAIHADSVRMRARYVERLDATLAAKIVLGDVRVELIAG